MGEYTERSVKLWTDMELVSITIGNKQYYELIFDSRFTGHKIIAVDDLDALEQSREMIRDLQHRGR